MIRATLFSKLTALSCIVLAYSLGAFNDNLFKQSSSLLSIAMGNEWLQNLGVALFSLPFILFSHLAGVIADKYPKKNVVIFSKFLEALAVLLGIYALLNVHFILLLVVIVLLALQSTLFGPALNGSIPEIFEAHELPKANALVKTASTLAILLGIVAAGSGLVSHFSFTENFMFLYDFMGDKDILASQMTGESHISNAGVLVVALGAFLVSVVGILTSFGIIYRPAAAPHLTIHFKDVLLVIPHSIKESIHYLSQKKLALALLSSCLFYFISTCLVQILNLYGNYYNLGPNYTSYLLGAMSIGIALGAIAGGVLSSENGWYKYLHYSCAGMGFCLLSFLFFPFLLESLGLVESFHLFVFTAIFLLAAGIFGGVFLIPVISAIQLLPSQEEKGRVIGINNFLDFSGMAISGGIAWGLSQVCKTPNIQAFILGLFTVICSFFIYFYSRKIFQDK